ncbi:MAG: flagellar hook-length control protein FliK [Lachnospiraceae bacterium]|nr:flagellar hook-length control protein FliK [Lachnospiraceae bacterium]
MQIQDTINAANFLSVGMGAASKDSANVSDSDFASFLNTTDKASDDKNVSGVSAEKELFPEKKTRDKVDLSKTNNDRKNIKSADNKTDDADKDVKAKKADLSESSNKENAPAALNVKETDNVSSAVSPAPIIIDDIEIDLDDMEALIEALGDVVQVVMNHFDMTVNEVETALNDMGMDFSDLLTEEGEKTFFLNMESADVSDLLTDEALITEFSDFVSDIKGVTEEVPMDPEVISKVADNNMISDEDVKEIVRTNTEETGRPVLRPEDGNDHVIADNDVVKTDDKQEPVVKVNVDDKASYDEDNSNNSHVKEKIPEKKMHNTTTSSKEVQNTIIQSLNEAVASVEQIAEVSEAQTTHAADIVEQIVEQIRVNINQDNTSLEMQLYPEHLGRIQIHVVSKDGVMTARISAETEAAKQAIEAGLNNLKESLQNQNLKVDAIEVMVSTTGFAESNEQKEQYQNEANNRKNSSGLGFSGEDEEDEEDDAAKMQAEGSSVSYRA